MMSLDNTQAVDDFVEGLTSVNVLFMSNDDPDVRVFRVLDESHLNILVADSFGEGDDVVQMIVENKYKGSDECKNFRLFLQGYGTRKPINYKLESFMRMIRLKGIPARCDKAIVVGMDGPIGSLVSVPPELAIGFVPEIGTMVATEIFDCLGKWFPCELAWEVMSFLSHPVADIMRDHIKESNSHCMFYLGWTFELDRSSWV